MKTVLIIDDDADIRVLIERILSRHGYLVLQAGDEAEALNVINGTSEIDAAVVDFWLGTTPSLSLLDALVAQRPNIPVMVISGGGGDVPIEVSHSLSRLGGAVSFLQKPFTRADLVEKITAITTVSKKIGK